VGVSDPGDTAQEHTTVAGLSKLHLIHYKNRGEPTPIGVILQFTLWLPSERSFENLTHH
jgi:hypothetical protein